MGLSLVLSPESVPDLRYSDLEFQAMQASGAGGQHINRDLATSKLAVMLEERRVEAGAHARRDQWSAHQGLERGNPVRTYTGPQFKLKVAK